MKILKVRDVKTPSRGTSQSAGIDFYVPNDFPGVHFLAPGQAVNIPSGIKAEIPKGFVLIAFNKSGVALKKGLTVGACVVDEDYQGEIHLHVYNSSDYVTQIEPGEKLMQFVLLPTYYCEITEVAELFNSESERGTGGFGSTGTN